MKRLTLIMWAVLISMSGSMTAIAADQQGLTNAGVETWLEGYKEAWETLAPDKAAQLFTEDATYQDDPYSDSHLGREGVWEYWAAVTADQKDVDFTYEVLAVTGNTGIAHWRSEFLQPSSGATIILDGIFMLEFSQEGLCQSLKEWWNLKFIPVEGS